MKNTSFLIAAIAVTSLVACNNGTESTTTTSDTSTVITNSTSEVPPVTEAATTINIRPDVSYIDLNSGKQVKLRVDTVTKYVVNRESNAPVYYYIDPTTSDTFDKSGRMVNDALVHGTDGLWTLDESKLKMRVQNNGDIMVKDGEGNKVKIDANGDKVKAKSSDGSKVKMDGNSYKSKTDSTKIKIKQ